MLYQSHIRIYPINVCCTLENIYTMPFTHAINNLPTSPSLFWCVTLNTTKVWLFKSWILPKKADSPLTSVINILSFVVC